MLPQVARAVVPFEIARSSVRASTSFAVNPTFASRTSISTFLARWTEFHANGTGLRCRRARTRTRVQAWRRWTQLHVTSCNVQDAARSQSQRGRLVAFTQQYTIAYSNWYTRWSSVDVWLNRNVQFCSGKNWLPPSWRAQRVFIELRLRLFGQITWPMLQLLTNSVGCTC